MMHENIRAADPDFSEVGLAVIQFSAGDNDSRNPIIYHDHGVRLFELAQLDAMVRETQEIWLEVLAGREDDTRRKGTGTRGTLL